MGTTNSSGEKPTSEKSPLMPMKVILVWSAPKFSGMWRMRVCTPLNFATLQAPVTNLDAGQPGPSAAASNQAFISCSQALAASGSDKTTSLMWLQENMPCTDKLHARHATMNTRTRVC